MNIFEYAVRNKLRFPFKGEISVEDLYDLPMDDLDRVYKSLNSQVKQTKEESLITSKVKTKEEERLDIKIELVKYVFEQKEAEKKARLQAQARKAQRDKIASLIAEKEDEALKNSSKEELMKMLDELE